MDDGQPMQKPAISEELSGSDSVKHESECHSPAHIKGPLSDSLIQRDGPPYQLQGLLKCFGVVPLGLEIFFYLRHDFKSVAPSFFFFFFLKILNPLFLVKNTLMERYILNKNSAIQPSAGDCSLGMLGRELHESIHWIQI